jgi:hypothetical protein
MVRPFSCVFLSLLFIGASARCELLHEVQPFDSLGDIKKKYPNAYFSRVKAAWVNENQDFFSMGGQGFPGTLYLAFTDRRPYWRAEIKKSENVDAEQHSALFGSILAAQEKRNKEIAEKLATESDDDALLISWVRWVPREAIPMQRFKSKYGEPNKCDFSSTDMTPYCIWKNRNLIVNLSDDQKMVLTVESQFTKEEINKRLAEKGYAPLPSDEKISPDTSPSVNQPHGYAITSKSKKEKIAQIKR